MTKPSGPYLASIAIVAARHGLTREQLADLTEHIEDVPDHWNATPEQVEQALRVCRSAWDRRAAEEAECPAETEEEEILALLWRTNVTLGIDGDGVVAVWLAMNVLVGAPDATGATAHQALVAAARIRTP